MIDVRALLLDIGNSRLKWGLLEDGHLRRTGDITHARLHDSGFSALTARLPRRLDKVLASNVAGAGFARRLSGVIGIHCDRNIQFARCERTAHGVTIGYRQPRLLGVDRWVAMIAVRAEFRGAVCIVDAGTAVTIDALDSNGNHLGGQIIPGLVLMGTALRSDTIGISDVKRAPQDPRPGMAMFANNTDAAVHNGAINAVCGAIERAVRTLRASGHRTRIVLTGGDASRILKQLGDKALHRPHLVLQGLAYMVQSES